MANTAFAKWPNRNIEIDLDNLCPETIAHRCVDLDSVCPDASPKSRSRHHLKRLIPMTKPTNTIRRNTTHDHRDVRDNTQTLCIAMRLWGFDESEVQSWMSELPDLQGALSWKISRVRRETDADIVVHLVKPARRTNDEFCWHSIQANRAVLASFPANRTEMVLFTGNANELPSRRSGHWALTGTLSPHTALARLGRLVAASSTPHGAMHGPVRRDLLRMIAQQLDAE
ncbi:hypothetical protein [Paraburkholderia diazotrophica]|uniref:Uncharacterized protein n=1 Tax=Paraburkholderia diazotrophica TaxID=667676 RepID=A0A1H7CS85_9BURK|nr:hypothetical protein [Paraburkholderia diazotrophica]SEJ91437.1 hypothetical protein SAMN05192539_102363 [Paraburkholderia diazotrophica]